MSFHFKKMESPANGVKRLCRERIDAALERLRKCDRPTDIHGVRKEIKKLRAIFRLVRGETGRGDYRKGAKALRRAANQLAATRDARVMLRAFQKLAGGRAARRFPNVQKALKKHCRREARRFRDKDLAGLARRMLRKTGRRAANLEIKESGWAAIKPGLDESYRRGREAFKRVRLDPSPENCHAWRKQVKDLWHYHCLLSPGSPPAARARTAGLESLGKLLGEDHDLFLLQRFAAEPGTDQARELEALARLTATRQAKLRAAALRLGCRLYAETPAGIGRQMEKDWNDWRGRAPRKQKRRFDESKRLG